MASLGGKVRVFRDFAAGRFGACAGLPQESRHLQIFKNLWPEPFALDNLEHAVVFLSLRCVFFHNSARLERALHDNILVDAELLSRKCFAPFRVSSFAEEALF